PGVSAATHPYIATGLRSHKFGVDMADAEQIFEAARRHRSVNLDTVSFHIGSQLMDTQPIAEAVRDTLALIGRLRDRGFTISSLDIGGGLGVPQHVDERPPNITEFVQAICALTARHNLRIIVEPGRSIVAQAGVLVTRVLYRKQSGSKHFIVVDAGMNDLIRPSLYQAHHEVLPLRETASHVVADLVGPVCETGDFFALDRQLPNVQPGDVLAIATAGAYGFAQSSNYNGRPRPAEVLIEADGLYRVIRARETNEDLIRGE
ncbi:MAG TPA: diaminopimelate decarboxylase, partial [Candidatus Acidoferrales bacterium]|nr:diaminopimelate decarboxylase [Candidatus Acidoferrales bacterium]